MCALGKAECARIYLRPMFLPKQVDFCLVKLCETRKCLSEVLCVSFFQPFLVVFYGEVSMLTCNSSVTRITETAEDLFHLWDLSLEHNHVAYRVGQFRSANNHNLKNLRSQRVARACATLFYRISRICARVGTLLCSSNLFSFGAQKLGQAAHSRFCR